MWPLIPVFPTTSSINWIPTISELFKIETYFTLNIPDHKHATQQGTVTSTCYFICTWSTFCTGTPGNVCVWKSERTEFGRTSALCCNQGYNNVQANRRCRGNNSVSQLGTLKEAQWWNVPLGCAGLTKWIHSHLKLTKGWLGRRLNGLRKKWSPTPVSMSRSHLYCIVEDVV